MERHELFTARSEEIFCAALEHDEPAARGRFLEQACANDTGLRARVEALLAAHEQAGRLFAESSAALVLGAAACHALAENPELRQNMAPDTTPDSPTGTEIGPYRLMEVLGQGGCGLVYLARQEEPVRRQVALKVIKLGMDTRSVIARFDAERQALAMMDHPNIARVLDAGATEAGRPYFVMELVHGSRITRYCDQNRLDMPQRLRLFVQVCHALQHAHQKGVIHRDIKPSNILVTVHDGEPRPKVIDFGIAKAVEGRLTDETLLTSHEHFIGTPAYMSPEQAQGCLPDVDTRSDIYSLGVLLYELLIGRPPFDNSSLLSAGVDEMRRILREREPLPPSAMFDTLSGDIRGELGQLRRTEAAKLGSLMRGDLDWITTKALEKDRDRRYRSAGALARDIQRHLENEPVSARPPSRRYRLQKLIRRHRVVFASGATVALALAAGLALTAALLLRERQLRQEQARLLAVAERGRSMEAELRRQAEWREGIRQVAELVHRKAHAEADALLARLPSQPPTSEGSDMLRTLGEWNALRENWSGAKARYQSLLRANRFENLDSASLDLMAAAVSIVKSGDRESYLGFRREIVAAACDASDPMVVDRVLKSALLLPASPESLAALQPFARVAEAHLQQPSGPDSVGPNLPWRAQTLALWKYREERYPDAIAWADRVLAAGEHPLCRSSSAHLIRAMALQRMHRTDQARSELGQARAAILARYQKPLLAYDPDGGFWFDWIISEILLAETSSLVENPSEGPNR